MLRLFTIRKIRGTVCSPEKGLAGTMLTDIRQAQQIQKGKHNTDVVLRGTGYISRNSRGIYLSKRNVHQSMFLG